MATFASSEETDDGTRRLSAAVLHGAIGGVLATIVMTAYRLPVARSLPPTREFWAQYGPGGGDGTGSIVALLLHLGYGCAAGIPFAVAIERVLPRDDSETVREGTGIVLGACYGGALSLFGSRMVLSRVLSMDLADDEGLVFHVGHLIYGVTLGTWVGSRVESAE